MKPRKFSIEVQLDLRNLLLSTIGLHHMEGRFLHLLTGPGTFVYTKIVPVSLDDCLSLEAQFFSAPFIYSRIPAVPIGHGDTCTVCGHPTMSNYFTMYSYEIVGVAVLAFAYCSGYHCYSSYLSNYKLGVHVYCLWPPHYYTLGVHMYCLWPLLFMCLTIVLVCIVYTTPITLVNCTPTSQLPIRVSYNSVSVYYFY